MSTVQQAIEVSAPLHTVYEQLATFESYPQFMTGVQQVTQISDDQTHWIMDLDGQRREFDAQITECSLDERVSWSTMDGPLLAETITLMPVGAARTQIVAQLEADAAFLMPTERHGQETLNRRLKADLASFKQLIEHDTIGGRQISGVGTITSGTPRGATNFGGGAGPGGGSAGPDPASPSAVAARAARNRGGGQLGGHLSGTQMGAAGMGGQAMSDDDAWGTGMINEEERGSAHDG
jgi:ribosome-associated toxin RatA of RatAB toxin-antitoxin module